MSSYRMTANVRQNLLLFKELDRVCKEIKPQLEKRHRKGLPPIKIVREGEREVKELER